MPRSAPTISPSAKGVMKIRFKRYSPPCIENV
jgi:hypothetical protein